jgi:hypothetical protein
MHTEEDEEDHPSLESPSLDGGLGKRTKEKLS